MFDDFIIDNFDSMDDIDTSDLNEDDGNSSDFYDSIACDNSDILNEFIDENSPLGESLVSNCDEPLSPLHDSANSDDTHSHAQPYHPSFMGVGRCECGCGSFLGYGDICSACHHPYSAHSRYKK